MATLVAQEQEAADAIETQMESLFGSTSGNVVDPDLSLGGPDDLDPLDETILEELISENLLKDEPPQEEEDELPVGEEAEFDIKVDDLEADDCTDWSEHLDDLVDQMGYLGSSP